MLLTALAFLALLAFFLYRERQFSRKLAMYNRFVEEMPFEGVLFDDQLRFQLICGDAVKNPETRRWLIGRTDEEYWAEKRGAPEVGKARMARLRQAIEAKSQMDFEEKLTDREGRERFFIRRIKSVFDKRGKLQMVMGFGFDFTEASHRERELERLNRDLRRSNEDLANFAHVASHDLKAPLRGVVSFLQLLERKNRQRFDETDFEYLRYAINSGKQMHDLIEAMLNFSRIDRQNDPPRVLNLDNQIELVRVNLRNQIAGRNASLTADPLPQIMAQDFHISQLFQNLIENGIKYNQSPAPEIHVSIAKTEKGDVFSIRDNGIGIPPEFWEKIFQIFRRLHASAQYEGSGIGLAACKRIVEFYGGDIWLESEPGKGTVFYFTLPGAVA